MSRMGMAVLGAGLVIFFAVTNARSSETERTNEGRTASGFYSVLLLTRQPDAFFEQWQQPARPDHGPNIAVANSAVAGEIVTALILFAGCKADDAGNCRVESRLLVDPPGDRESLDTGNIVQWAGEARPLPQLILGESAMGIGFDAKDPLGEFVVSGEICDVIAEECVKVSSRFISESPENAVANLQEFIQGYFRDPRPLLVPALLEKLQSDQVLHERGAIPPAVGFLAAVFHANPQAVEAWRDGFVDREPITRTVLDNAAKISPDPLQQIASMPLTPSSNDMLWGAFFASGDKAYVLELVDRIEYTNERNDRTLFFTGSSARWSLASNATQHREVREILTGLIQQESHPQHAALVSILSESPEVHRQRTIEIMQEQREKGVW